MRASSPFKQISRVILILVLITQLAVPMLASTPAWFPQIKKIQLFVMDRSEVEKILGTVTVVDSQKGKMGLSVEYASKYGKISALYSNGGCPFRGYDWNVDKGTVTEIEISLKKPTKIKSLGLNMSSYIRTDTSDLVGHFTLTNSVTGEYLLGYNDRINSLKYWAADEQNEKLKCQ